MYLFLKAKKRKPFFKRFWPKLVYSPIAKKFTDKGKGVNPGWLTPIRIYPQERENILLPGLSKPKYICVL